MNPQETEALISKSVTMEEEWHKVSNWAALVNKWEFNKNIKYCPMPEGRLPWGIALSNIEFKDGVIKVNLQFPEITDDTAGRILIGFKSIENKYISVGLGGYGYAYVISKFDPGSGWRGVKLAGDKSNLKKEVEYNLEVRILGQQLLLTVNEVRVFEATLEEPLAGNQIGLLAKGDKEIIFDDFKVSLGKSKAFVIMEYQEKFNYLYRDVIAPVAEKLGFTVYRADEVYQPGIVLNDIIQGIMESKVVVAEITPPNPNVFYELGYAHAMKKPTILLAEKGEKLPFDISGYRCIFYDNSIHGKIEVEKNLRRHLNAILNN